MQAYSQDLRERVLRALDGGEHHIYTLIFLIILPLPDKSIISYS